jgi:hypothetical protein
LLAKIYVRILAKLQVDPAIRAIYQKHNAGNSLYRNPGTGAFECPSEQRTCFSASFGGGLEL